MIITDTDADSGTSLSHQRLHSSTSSSASALASDSPEGLPRRFHHYTVSTLSHLLALILHPPPGFLPDKTSLLVVEGVNALVDLDYPRYNFASSSKTEAQKWQASRRYGVLGSIASALNKLAVLNSLAVIVTTGCATRQRADSGLGAALVPGIGSTEWDSSIWNRIVIFRDFAGRFAGIQKCQGKTLVSRDDPGDVGKIVGFDIGSAGTLRERVVISGPEGGSAAPPKRVGPVKPPKRSFDEVADSEDEDVDEYGWADTDEDAVAREGLMVKDQPAELVDPPD